MEMYYTLDNGGKGIPCLLQTPNYGEVRRVVLGVHGLGGSMEDAIQTGIAEEMALFGAVSVR